MAYDFSRYCAVLLDLDGTVCHEDHALPGALELLKRLEGVGQKFACLSNNTASPNEVSQRLARIGVRLDASHIYTAGAGAADYVLDRWHDRKPHVLNLATEGVRELLEGKVNWAESDRDACDVVIVGTPGSRYATEARQRLAVVHLRRGAALVGTSADRLYTSPRGVEIGSGAFTQMLAYAANVSPVFTGKPEPLFLEELCRNLNVEPARCILIGDNPESDLAGARAVGMKCILSLTGVVGRGDLDRLPGHLRPDHVINDLSELL